MNDSVAVPNEGSWPLAPLAGGDSGAIPGQRTYSATNILDFSTLVRIIHPTGAGWWLVGLRWGSPRRLYVADHADLSGIGYSGSNPPTVAVTDERTRERDAANVNSYDFVATQVGLLSAKSVAERTAQELDLANNPTIVAQDADPSKRLRSATAAVASGLKVIAPDQGTLIKFSYDSPSPQLAAMVAKIGVADRFINTALQRRYEASAYARNFLERQIAKTRADLRHSERSLAAYAQRRESSAPASGPTASRRWATRTRCRENRSLRSIRRSRMRRRGVSRPKALTGRGSRPAPRAT